VVKKRGKIEEDLNPYTRDKALNEANRRRLGLITKNSPWFGEKLM
jgi:hypothetical protein